VAVKKVLIITYYWPPSGGGGVQRWLKFVKFLRDFNWEPVVYTPSNPDFELHDDDLLEDIPQNLTVIKRPIWEPFGLYRMLFGKKAVQKQGVVGKSSNSFLSQIAIWVRGNYFIPDSRIFWVRPSVNYLSKYLKTHEIDVIITTGPPHSIHLIGLELKKRFGIKWVADFRDPWSKWDVLDQLKLNDRSRNSHRKLERMVLSTADQILTVSPSLKASLVELGAKRIDVITNGYDLDLDESDHSQPDKFRIAYAGLLTRGRNPGLLWQVLNEIASEIPGFSNDLEIYLAGTIEEDVIKSIEMYPEIRKTFSNNGYISHTEVIDIYKKSAILLLVISNTDNASWILPGKMFEYMALRKPILSVGNAKSDASDVLKEAGYNPCFDYDDKQGMKAFILFTYESYKNKEGSKDELKVEKYHRRELTKSLAACLDQL